MEIWIKMLQDPNTQWVLMGCLLLGISSGVIGSFALLRKHALIGDAMAHAALPGITIVFMIFGVKSIGLFLVGAAISGMLASYLITQIPLFSRIKEDTALGMVLSVFFGIGVVFLTIIQQSGAGNQSGLDHFLFGQAASLVRSDVNVMMIIAAIILLVTLLLFKEFKLLSFDPNYGRGLGFPMGLINFLMMALIVAAVVIGLQAVGVVLMSAMLITPAIAARYWTDNLKRMIMIAGAIGALSGVFGSLLSTLAPRMPTGPLIVLTATGFFIISLLFAPKRGLISKAIRFVILKNKVAREHAKAALKKEEWV